MRTNGNKTLVWCCAGMPGGAFAFDLRLGEGPGDGTEGPRKRLEAEVTTIRVKTRKTLPTSGRPAWRCSPKPEMGLSWACGDGP